MRTWNLVAAIPLLVSGLASPAAPQDLRGPIDRAMVSIRPIYPMAPPGSLRLPETRSAPIGPARVLQGPIAGIGPVTLPETTGERPAWHPARLEVVPVIDARGWISATLEYTPGRFDR